MGTSHSTCKLVHNEQCAHVLCAHVMYAHVRCVLMCCVFMCFASVHTTARSALTRGMPMSCSCCTSSCFTLGAEGGAWTPHKNSSQDTTYEWNQGHHTRTAPTLFAKEISLCGDFS
jgi:hypothetical protein